MTTNYERIKNMTVEEMAELFKKPAARYACKFCVGCPSEENEFLCITYIKQWLQAESEDK